MSTIINASTSAGLLITPDNSGVLQLQQNGVNLPALSVAPAFSAYNNPTTSFGSSSWTKIDLQNELFDTNNNFTSSRFTPTVAGYYQFNFGVQVSGGVSSAEIVSALSINGIRSAYGSDFTAPTGYGSSGSYLAYLNGTTDYVELYGYVSTSGKTTSTGQPNTFLNGFLARGV